MTTKKISKTTSNFKTSQIQSSEIPFNISTPRLIFNDVRPISIKDIICPCLKNNRKPYISKFKSI